MKLPPAKLDQDLRTDVLSALTYEPGVDVSNIGVMVKDGSVTLNGYVTRYGEKQDAVGATRRVAGVRAIADHIQVKLSAGMDLTDGEIATAVAQQIDSLMTIPRGAIQITVQEGNLVLEGQVEWWYQKDAAANAVQHLAGVRAVNNSITIQPKLKAGDLQMAIRSAFERHALLDVDNIHVATSGNKAVLTGKVPHYLEREEAERVAWAAPGVSSVDNQIIVGWS